MSIHKDDPGKRSIETEVDIEATPEAIWKAIATGPGFKAWFMGMDCTWEEREGGDVLAKMGDQTVPIAKVTAWDPPKHLGTLGDKAFGPDSPKIAYEWTIEAKEGGKCTLRMVQTLFAEDDAWDTQIGDTEAGWPAFFHVLRNYVERHDGRESGVVQAMNPVPGTKDEAFGRLAASLGIAEIRTGATVDCSVDGVPAFSGVIEDVVTGRSDRIMVGLQKPFPGTAWIGVGPIDDNMTAIVTMYYYGDGAGEAAARDGAQLVPWLQAHGEAVGA